MWDPSSLYASSRLSVFLEACSIYEMRENEHWRSSQADCLCEVQYVCLAMVLHSWAARIGPCFLILSSRGTCEDHSQFPSSSQLSPIWILGESLLASLSTSQHPYRKNILGSGVTGIWFLAHMFCLLVLDKSHDFSELKYLLAKISTERHWPSEVVNNNGWK